MVLMGSKAENAESLGRMLAYMRSKRTLSKTSRTKSMAAVCYAGKRRLGVPDWRGGRAELRQERELRSSEEELSMQEADVVVKQAWVW